MSPKPTLQDAIALATKYHESQTDKAGKPYISHPLRVMEKMMLEDEKIVAVLHDIVEDTSITLKDLKDMGYPSYIVNSIDCLSKREGESYDQFVKRTMTDTAACLVKLADIEDNMDLSRLKTVTEKDKARLKKYKMFYVKIKNHLDDEQNKVCKHCLEPPMYCSCWEDLIDEEELRRKMKK
jgi:(p)ppGpp synthase/HD superfamily hydrolase|tara:strand:- start:57 stop:599 length:543 start_codon:yes stop_codon:yes gene_type:complete